MDLLAAQFPADLDASILSFNIWLRRAPGMS